MEKNLTINELSEIVAAEMKKMGYANSTIKRFRSISRMFEQYANENESSNIFKEEIAEKYLKDKFGYTIDVKPESMTTYVYCNVLSLRRMSEYILHGSFKTHLHANLELLDWAGGDAPYVEKFLEKEREAEKSENTILSRYHSIRYFYQFLGFKGIKNISSVTAQDLSDYIISREGQSINYVYLQCTALKLYFKFLHCEGFCEKNLSLSVPRVTGRQSLNVPALWSDEELKQLLNHIDRGNPTGKRDYAILLMIIQYGIRASDVVGLRLSHLKWERETIEFAQQKTGKAIAFPMLKDVGWALIDYIRYGRPQTENPFVFLVAHGVPKELKSAKSLHGILRQRMKLSGLRKDAKRTTSGMHSLRHALARRLVANNIDLETAVSVMGHKGIDVASIYLRSNIDGLRECALSLEGL
jgi:site-specific recombinase XerD